MDGGKGMVVVAPGRGQCQGNGHELLSASGVADRFHGGVRTCRHARAGRLGLPSKKKNGISFL